jgi:O-antigen/teichoic acid export membrane protein
MIPILLTAWILNMSNRIFIEQYFSLVEVGVFSLAFRISSIVTIVLGGLFTAFNPVFYSLSNDNINIEESKNKLYNLCKIISFTVLFTCFSVCLVSKEIISLFFDKSYSPAIGLIPLIIVSILLVNISGLFNLMIYQEKKPKTIMYISIVGAFSSILLNFLLVPRYSMIGAAYASIITALIIMVIKYVYARKAYYIGLPIKSMFVYFVFGLIIIFFDMKFSYNLYYSLVIKCVILGLVIIVFYIKNKSLRKLIT